jgi:ATP-binding cassette subfamily B protein
MSPFSFIYSICKPYRKWYVCLCLAPIFSGVYFALNNYVIKIIIDTIVGEIVSYDVFLKPLLIFLGIELLLRFFWSLHDYSEYKLQGNIFRDVIVKPYEYLQNHSYSYFQTNFSGSLVSKLKGISDGLYSFWDNISHKLLESFSVILINIIMIAFLSTKLLIPVVAYTLIIGTICYFQSKIYDKYYFKIKQNWHNLLGKVSDKVSNIFTVFFFATKKREVKEIKDFYENIQIPAMNKINYYNFVTWIFTGLINTTMTLGIFGYAIYLRKMNIISTGVLTVTVLIVLRCCHEIFHLVNSVLSLIQNLADFRASIDGIFVKQKIIDKSDAVELVI